MKETRGIIKSPINETAELEPQFEAQFTPSGRYPGYREVAVREGFQMLDYWRAIRKRLWLVLGIAVLMTTLAAIYMARKPDVYRAQAVVQVDNEQNNPDVVTSDRQRPLSNPDPSYFNTQLQLLWSESLLRRAVKEHNLDANKDFQQARIGANSSAWRSILKSIGLATSEKTDKNSANAEDLGLATSDEIAEAVRLTPFVEVIRRNLEIEPRREARATVKDTRLIDISFYNTNPELAAFVVNSIAETFTLVNQEKRSGTSRKTNDFLQERIATLQSDIKADEQKLVDLTQSEGILKTGEDQTIVIDRLSGLNKALLEAENERKNAEADYMTVSNAPEKVNALAEDKMARFVTEQENGIRALKSEAFKEIATLRQKRALLLQEYQEGAPEIREIDDQIKSREESMDKATGKFQTDLDGYRQRDYQRSS